MSGIENLTKRQLRMIEIPLHRDWKAAEGQLAVLKKYGGSVERIQEGIRELEALVEKRRQEYEAVRQRMKKLG